MVSTNTFGANSLKFSDEDLEQIIKAAVGNAENARREFNDNTERFIALDIGPTGRLMAPFGDLDFDDAVAIFGKTVALGVKYGVDLIIIETMTDAYETKAAVLAAKENSNLPILVSNAYSNGGRLLTGATPSIMVSLLEGLDVDAIGANCSFGPRQLSQVAEEIIQKSSLPTTLKPNAGLPQMVDGKVVYDVKADEFGAEVTLMVKKGISAVGGCCGTTPEYIRSLTDCSKGLIRCENTEKEITSICSRSKAVEFDGNCVTMGNIEIPFTCENMDDIIDAAFDLQDEEVNIISINAKNLDADSKLLKDAVNEWQSMIDIPLMINFDNPFVLENILRYYNGKAMVGDIAPEEKVLTEILPILKKYGGVAVIKLENNNDYLKISQKVIEKAQEFGIHKKNIIFDMSIGELRDAKLQEIKKQYGENSFIDSIKTTSTIQLLR